MYIHCHPIVQWLSSVYQVYVKFFDNKILRPLPLLKFLLPQRKNRAFRLCLSGNNLATHKFSSNAIFASILQAQSPENIEYSTFLGLLYHSNSQNQICFYTVLYRRFCSIWIYLFLTAMSLWYVSASVINLLSTMCYQIHHPNKYSQTAAIPAFFIFLARTSAIYLACFSFSSVALIKSPIVST